MKRSKGIFLSGIVALALMWATNASATVIYDVVTNNGTVGQISFGVADNYVGGIFISQVSSFTWDASVIGDPLFPDPTQWQFSSLTGFLDAANSVLTITSASVNVSNTVAFLNINGANSINQLGSYDYSNLFNGFNRFDRSWLVAVQSSVPAPAVLGLLSMGLVGVGAATKRRNRKH